MREDILHANQPDQQLSCWFLCQRISNHMELNDTFDFLLPGTLVPGGVGGE